MFLFNKIKHTIKVCELKKIKAWMNVESIVAYGWLRSTCILLLQVAFLFH